MEDFFVRIPLVRLSAGDLRVQMLDGLFEGAYQFLLMTDDDIAMLLDEQC